MSKKVLVDKLHGVAYPTRSAADYAVEVVFAAVKEAVEAGETIQIRDFGSFSLKDKKGRIGRNPQTGEPIDIPAKRELAFKLPRKGK